MRIILLGPPGAGKGTQAKFISEKFGIPHISSGDIFMRNITEGTELGKKAKYYIDQGLLVPDEVTIDLVMNRLEQDDVKEGYLLDGFPRTVHQGQVLCKMLEERGQVLDVALLIDVPSSYIKERMPGRRICKFCGASYHLQFNPPENEGICNNCGHDLVQRRDDHVEAVEERLKVYEEQTKPLIDFFKEKKLLLRIDGKREIEEVSREIIEKLDVIDNNEQDEGTVSIVNEC